MNSWNTSNLLQSSTPVWIYDQYGQNNVPDLHSVTHGFKVVLCIWHGGSLYFTVIGYWGLLLEINLLIIFVPQMWFSFILCKWGGTASIILCYLSTSVAVVRGIFSQLVKTLLYIRQMDCFVSGVWIDCIL